MSEHELEFEQAIDFLYYVKCKNCGLILVRRDQLGEYIVSSRSPYYGSFEQLKNCDELMMESVMK